MTCRLLCAALALTAAAPAGAANPPLLRVLEPTGDTRAGLPVMRAHPDAARIEAVLLRGFSGRLLRLHALHQQFLHRETGRQPEPAYLVLSDRQGGFPREGLCLGDEPKPRAGWVDLHRSSRLTGRFGAVDQIFPHELLHVMVQQLAGSPRESGGNQVHAVGVRTDPVIAFSEGFAEHAQILAVDDPDAAPDTRALRHDLETERRAEAAVERYGRELARPWLPVRPGQLRFLLWFSPSEQVLRYHAVKANRFAREPAVPAALAAGRDRYDAYLFRSVVPGHAGDPPKPPRVLLSTEGVVAHLFWKLVTDDALRGRPVDPSVLERFGARADTMSHGDGLYLKLLVTLFDRRPATAAELLAAYRERFPEDQADLDRVVREALSGRTLPLPAPELWLASDTLMTGTSLFDQYRALPRAHTFDLNSATVFDWLDVPGVGPDDARRLVDHAPFDSVADPRLLALVSDTTAAEIQRRSRAMAALLADARSAEESISLTRVLTPYAWRLLGTFLVLSAVGAWIAHRAGARRWWSAGFVAVVSTGLVLGLAWVITAPWWYAAAAPFVIGAGPLGAWRAVRAGTLRPFAPAGLLWAAGAVPALVLVTWVGR